jgi:murein DD-endopeptidase MepM/ murein hydrolase activator NlpD
MAALVLTGARSRAVGAIESFLRVYAHILFSQNPAVGLVIVAATAMVPRAFAAGAIAVLAATAIAHLLDLDPEQVRSGDYGYGALLVGLGVGQTFGLGAAGLVLIGAGAFASVLFTASLRAFFGGASLPVLSLPFVAAFPLVLGAAAAFGVARLPISGDPTPFASSLPASVVVFVRSLGALFFLPRLDAGALIFAALLLHSRIAASLAAAAFTAALFFAGRAAALPEGVSLEGLGINAMLASMALGGVFFVPSTSSFLLGLAGASTSILLSIGLAAPFARAAIPMGILPFNLAVLIALFALRQRARDLRPKSVDFLSGTPEENLTYFRTRRSRFEQLHAVAFTLPVRGAWTCTQGIDGELTHQGAWRHAFDFEVRDADCALFRGEGASNDDYHCYRLPVLAAAEGTVVAVESAVADNAVGAMDLEKNWGNYVILQHAPNLHSLVAHLSRGSVKVVKGQYVRRGEVLGLCGSSGRSPRPHVHFQLQATAELGAPTLPCHFTDVVRESEVGARVEAALAPREDDVVRNLDPGEEVAAYLGCEIGKRWSFAIDGAVERVDHEVDLWGRLLARSRDRGASLFHGRSEAFFTAYDAVGDPRSVVRLLRAALSRVPFEARESLAWTDHLPARDFRPWFARAIWDIASPFLPRDGIEVEMRLRREGERLVIEGASKRRDRRGTPLVRTRAELARGRGPMLLELTVRGRTRRAVREDVDNRG